MIIGHSNLYTGDIEEMKKQAKCARTRES